MLLQLRAARCIRSARLGVAGICHGVHTPCPHTQERQHHEEDLEHNNGVYYSERLLPVLAAAGAGAWATGVKRSADKV
jgi:hypothetical protein